MGIIEALKAHPRLEIRCRIIKKINESVERDTKTADKIASEIFVLDAIHILETSWAKVTTKFIQNCWGKENSRPKFGRE